MGFAVLSLDLIPSSRGCFYMCVVSLSLISWEQCPLAGSASLCTALGRLERRYQDRPARRCAVQEYIPSGVGSSMCTFCPLTRPTVLGFHGDHQSESPAARSSFLGQTADRHSLCRTLRTLRTLRAPPHR